MATIALQVAGAAIGGLLGPVGGAIGAAAGALAGYAVDQILINGRRTIEGPRLAGARPFTAEEGVSLPRVYGTARTGGIVIWGTRFEETRTTRRQGKTGPRITEYSYFGNVAFALCEGEVASIRRIWADGREVDQSSISLRFYNGSEGQPLDPLISAKQGGGNSPAYRGTSYVVIERMPLADYGNRIPQFQFEVIRPVGRTAPDVRAVAMIPGATEYGLSPTAVTREIRKGETVTLNRHALFDSTDFTASLDELQACCPNLQHVALVVSWFGDDLRAGSCTIRPAVTTPTLSGLSQPWIVSGTAREDAMVVSTHNGGAAYGGTPSDRSVIAAIQTLKSRGLKVALYPFMMMDVPAGNSLPDPHGGVHQAPYPWRGRVTCHPGPDMPGTADRSAAARSQVNAFCGAAQPGHFSDGANTVQYSGPAGDWGYRRFILHHARLAAAAGGVDTFLVGTEFRGLTALRDGADQFPFVEQLCTLAGETRAMLGPATKITYAADWSEYFGHHPAGEDNLYFHLDPLWAHPAVNAVGIDNYMPLSDWRDGDYAGGNPDGFGGPYDPAGLLAAIAGGEGFDWFYASGTARQLRERTPITDGAYGKPWVYRYKDLVNWWSQPHHNRISGVEQAAATGWAPRSKPIWFTEVGCPAVDKGPNQPNVFPDPKSSESAAPYFSSGGRSDLAQQRFLEAHATYWSSGTDLDVRNPVSPSYGGRMVDANRSFVWAWDARPFPLFPLRGDEWADSSNWHYGHWINGRVASPTVGDLINAILADNGLPAAEMQDAEGTLHGYVVQDPQSARASIEPLADLFGLNAIENADGLLFKGASALAETALAIDDLVTDRREPTIERLRTPDHDLPTEAVLTFRDPLAEHQAVSVRTTRHGADGLRLRSIGLPAVMETGQGRALIADWMKRAWNQREEVRFAVPASNRTVRPGSVVRLAEDEPTYLVTGIEDGLSRQVAATQIARSAPTPWGSYISPAVPSPAVSDGQPNVTLLDLPAQSGAQPAEERLMVAAWRRPWKMQAVFVSPETTGFEQRTTLPNPASIGTLTAALLPGVIGRLDHANFIEVDLPGGELSSASMAQVLNGANTLAVRSAGGAWEIVQFMEVEEVAADRWLLRGLLRGQLGTEDATGAAAPVGATVVVLEEPVRPAGLKASEIGLALNWRVGPVGTDFSNANFATLTQTGGLRALTPLAPVHVRAERVTGGWRVSWIRRSRVDADSWLAAEIPLGETSETYRIEIAAVAGATVRTATTIAASYVYSDADILADFGSPVAALAVSIRQQSSIVGWGIAAVRNLTLN